MGIILDGIVQWKTGGQSIVAGIPVGLAAFGAGDTLGIPNTVYVMALVALLAYYLLVDTPFGRYLTASARTPGRLRLCATATRGAGSLLELSASAVAG